MSQCSSSGSRTVPTAGCLPPEHIGRGCSFAGCLPPKLWTVAAQRVAPCRGTYLTLFRGCLSLRARCQLLHGLHRFAGLVSRMHGSSRSTDGAVLRYLTPGRLLLLLLLLVLMPRLLTLLLLLLLRPRLLPLTLLMLMLTLESRRCTRRLLSLIWDHLITQPWLIRPVTRERQRRPTTHRCAHRGSAFGPLLGVGIS